ncbi:DUF5011 domain-containing protein [Sporosarcina sp. PTS2304]|uniref:DUF5011 domain-containing protein n=1 Tax=Sporosarcina sp. PTS2304 TaxID=2283194 RepID=UPI000E0CC93E|nr:DUF5011 domain-containing protein [Sporosarcina sp. PTS2304]AXH98291.1 DUF5011 domain-containing protein [Sporosarcina sp. PTS2304]
MNKFFCAFLSFLLVFTTLGPLPSVASSFSGSVPSTVEVETNDKANISVTMNGGNNLWQIILRDKDTNAQIGNVLGSESEFTDVSPGLYVVEAAKTIVDSEGMSNTITEISPVITVKPKALTTFESSPYQLIVKEAMIGSTVNLYKPGSTTPYQSKAVDANREVIFDGIDANKAYRVTQTFNRAESTPSGLVSVKPDKVTIQSPKDSGATNNLGELTVVNTKKENMLILYRAENEGELGIEEKRMPSTGVIHKFDGLRAGVYTVRQVEDTLESELSNELVIKNQQKPILELEGPATIELHHNKSSQDTYTEFGVNITDKNGTTTQRTEPISCTPGVKISLNIMYLTFNGHNTKPNPGEYIVRYTATDCTDPSLYSSIDRKVIVYPETIELERTKDTLETHGTSPIEYHITGEITVKNVFNNATLTLYQDPSGSNTIENARVIQKKVRANGGSFTFQRVPVGIGYFVVQEFGGVQSESSERMDILDTTPPELKLKGTATMEIEVGTPFVDPGYDAKDNIDVPGTLQVIIGGDTVNEKVPGSYTITYDVKDEAGNEAVDKITNARPALTRTVIVKPKPVIAIGSIATKGEIGVTNIFVGIGSTTTTLKLYKANSDDVFTNIPITEKILDSKETTYVFKNLSPGRYRVTQEVNGISSNVSNTAEVVDIDKPYITLQGPEHINVTMGSSFDPYYTSSNRFTDPGATADDYLLSKDGYLFLSAVLTGPTTDTIVSEITNVQGTSIQLPSVTIQTPGLYTIKYVAKAIRGKEADPKYRTITVAPEKLDRPNYNNNTKELNVLVKQYGTLPNAAKPTIVKLYNSYDQLMDTKLVTTGTVAIFTNVPAGIGYYATQTVNGIESQPSLPINISIFDEVKTTAQITDFNFKEVDAISVIDHNTGPNTGTISVTVPKGTLLTSLTPVMTIIGTISPDPEKKTNFTNDVIYTVRSTDNTPSRIYTVKVTVAKESTTVAKPIEKNIVLSTSQPTHSLTAAERTEAMEKGITFSTLTTKLHVPASNVVESSSSTLTFTEPTKGTFEVNWGNLSRFMQPVELELPKFGTKVFAKVMEVNGKQYTIVLPSSTTTTKITGLIREPGAYTLVDKLDAPIISAPTKKDGKNSYKLNTSAKDPAIKIYYTTSSKDISFVRSAQTGAKPALSNYVIDASPADILKWTEYQAGQTIETNAELYAVVVKNGQISPVATLPTDHSIDWSKTVPAYDTHKVLSVKFNARVDREALYSGLIFVTDDTTNQKVETELQMSNDGKTIYVVPKTAYTRGKQYTLHIDRQFKGNTKNKEFLKKSLLQTFKIK